MGWLDPRAHTRLLALRFLLGLVRSRSSGSTSLAMYQVVPPLDKRLRYPVPQPKGHGGNARGVHHEDPDEFPPDNAPVCVEHWHHISNNPTTFAVPLGPSGLTSQDVVDS